ncbi:MAG: DUF3515 domain-containing protein [Pseudonocardiaceae bacterium]
MGTRRQVGMPRLLSAVALILPMALVVGVLVTASVVRGQRPPPLLLPVAAAPEADSADCAHLAATLPQELDGGAQGSLDRRELAAAVPSDVAAWGEPPVVLRCGLDRPAELTATSRLLDISGVQFLETPHPTASAWVAVDRPRYVAVVLPPGSGSGPLQQIAEVITETLPARPLDLPR